MSPLRIGFIGAGQFANIYHYPSLERIADVRVVAVCDLDTRRRDSTAEKYDIPARYFDYQEMLERESLDGVYVIMKPGPLMPIVLDVLGAGLPVFTEKPCGLDTGQTRRMADAAAAARGGTGVVTCVGCNRRYAPLMREAGRLVRERGAISSAVAAFHKPMHGDVFGMSVLHTDGIHALDPLRSWLGEPAEVHTFVDTPFDAAGWNVSDQVYNAAIRFDGGASAVFTANRRSGARLERYELHGDGITCIVEPPERLTVYREGEDERRVITGAELAGVGDTLATYGYLDESRAFLDAIRSGRDTPTGFADNVKTMELCDAIAGGVGPL